MAELIQRTLDIEPTELTVLESALKILSDESKWAQGYFAFDSHGSRCAAESPMAETFCLIGSIRRAAIGNWNLCLKSLKVVENQLNLPVSAWNDNAERKHSEVIDILKKSIGSLKNV